MYLNKTKVESVQLGKTLGLTEVTITDPKKALKSEKNLV